MPDGSQRTVPALNLPDIISERVSGGLTVIPLRRCNIRCTHCFISNEHKAMKAQMPRDLYETATRRGLAFFEHVPVAALEFDVMGGELHLLDEAYLNWILDFTGAQCLEHLAAAGPRASGPALKEMIINIITNLINIPAGKIESYRQAVRRFDGLRDAMGDRLEGKDARMTLSTSWEPDTNRFYRDEVYRQWVRNVRSLTDDGVQIGLCLTGTKGTIETPVDDIISMALDDLGVKEVMFDYFGPSGEGKSNNADMLPGYDELADFMSELVIKGGGMARARGLDDAIAPHYEPGRPLEQLHCRLLADVIVDYDGAVAMEQVGAADKQFSKQDTFYIQDGDVYEAIGELLRRTQRNVNREYRQMLKIGCTSCPHVRECQGGFTHYVEHFTADGQCPGVKPFLDRVAAHTADADAA